MCYLLRINSILILIRKIFISLLILSSIGLHNLTHAHTTSEPVQLEEIVVTPGKFTVQDGTDASLSLSKDAIDLFPLIDNDVFRAAHIFPGVTANDFSAEVQPARRREGRNRCAIGRDGAVRAVSPARFWRGNLHHRSRSNSSRRPVYGRLPRRIRR